jgi:ribonuclease D
MTIITDTEALAEFCSRQRGVDFIAVDTEFMRERTYWPILCLAQIAGPSDAAAIDALAPGIDLLEPFQRRFSIRRSPRWFAASAMQ